MWPQAAQAAREAALQQQQQQAEEAQRRRRQLANGFKSIAVAVAPAHGAAGSQQAGGSKAAQGVPVAVADEWEVARVLDSKSDYECLKVRLKGCPAARVDECRVRRPCARVLQPDLAAYPPCVEALQLHAGASLAQVRQTYKAMAMALHPDKCKLDGAAAAFQRLKKAYDHLSSTVAMADPCVPRDASLRR